MSDIDYNRISNDVVRKLKETNREKRDAEFIDTLMLRLQEQQTPCHLLSKEEVICLQDLIVERKKLGKGLAWLALAVLAMWVKDIYNFVSSFIHFGGSP